MEASSIDWKKPVSGDGQTTITGTFTANGKNYEVSIIYSTRIQSAENISQELTNKISKIGTDSLAKLVGYTFKSVPKETPSKANFQIFHGEKAINELSEELKSAESEIHGLFNMFLSGKNEGIQQITTKSISLPPNATIQFQEVVTKQDPLRKEALLGGAIAVEKKEKLEQEDKGKEEKEEQIDKHVALEHQTEAQEIHKNNTSLSRISGKILLDPTFDPKTGVVSCSKKQFFRAQKQLNVLLKEKNIDKTQATHYLQIILTGSSSIQSTLPPLFRLTDLKPPPEKPFQLFQGNPKENALPPILGVLNTTKNEPEKRSLDNNLAEAARSFHADNLGRPQTITLGDQEHVTGKLNTTWSFLTAFKKQFIQNINSSSKRSHDEIKRSLSSPFAKKLKEFHGKSLFDEASLWKVICKGSEKLPLPSEDKANGDAEKNIIQRFRTYAQENIIAGMSTEEVCGKIKAENDDVEQMKQVIDKAWSQEEKRSFIFLQSLVLAGKIDPQTLEQLAKQTTCTQEEVQAALFLKIMEIIVLVHQAPVANLSNPLILWSMENRSEEERQCIFNPENDFVISKDLNSFEMTLRSTSTRGPQGDPLFKITSKAVLPTSTSQKTKGTTRWIAEAFVSPFFTEKDLQKLENLKPDLQLRDK